MRIFVNGEPLDALGPTLADLLKQVGHGGSKVATAVNETFVPADRRETYTLTTGDRVEIVAPRQGG